MEVSSPRQRLWDRVRDSKSSLFWRAISRRSTTPAWEEIMRRFSWRITVFSRQCHGHVPVRDGAAVQRGRSFLGSSAALKRGSGEHSTLHAARQGWTADVGRAALSQGSKSETDHLRYTIHSLSRTVQKFASILQTPHIIKISWTFLQT